MATVLSIDDDPQLQDLFRLAFRERGHELESAFTGEDGYQKALALKPGLILLDVMLPTINGLEVLKLLKANEAVRGIPVIVVSGISGEPPFTEDAMKALGATAFLKKPVLLEELALLADSALAASPGGPSSPKGP
ncbi:MAG: response regulator [Elusimicrobia bacterium]|nr:response regulator [Elusimicrobiota bacterium]